MINLLIQSFKRISCSRKLEYVSATRNQLPILGILQKVLDPHKTNLKLLEISSGSGQHCALFADNFPNIIFYPSEYSKNLMSSIKEYAQECKYSNMRDPIYIDIEKDFEKWDQNFKSKEFDYILNINMIHVTPWSSSVGLFNNASKLLKDRGLLLTYGPYAVDGILTPESNVRFNESLKEQNPEWAVRDLRDLTKLSSTYGIEISKIFDMPANNKLVVWQKV